MILQRILFPERNKEVQELYVRTSGNCIIKPDRVRMEAGSSIQTDTYFNGFFPEEWEKYTEVTEVKLTIQLKGKCSIFVLETKKNTGVMEEECLFTAQWDSVEKGVIEIPFSLKKISGIVSVRIEAEKDTEFYSGKWECTQKVQKEIQIALIICTYRKENYIQHNIEYLKKKVLENAENQLYGKIKVYIVDNGKTLKLEPMAGVEVIPNENTGGAGGFTKGMQEAVSKKELYAFTHILLMDDDVTIEAGALEKTYSVLSYVKDEYHNRFLGGAMLRQDIPYIQHEAGGIWNEGAMEAVGQGYDLRKKECLLESRDSGRRKKPNYAAWWYCCIPIEYVEKNGYPLPFFIHFDDIEYSLRESQEPLYLKGIGIWHEQFEQKRSSSIIYYDMRNTLYTYQLHGAGKKMQMWKLVVYEVYSALARYRYLDAELVFKAVEDYRKGIEWLKMQDPEKLHMQICRMGYQWEEHSEIVLTRQLLHQKEILYSTEESSKKRLWRLLTLNGSFLPINKKEEIYLPFGAMLNQYYRADKIFLYDPATGKGAWVKKDWHKMMCAIGKLLKLAVGF